MLPVARVVVDSPLAHLDRPFDYLVPTTLDADVVPGCRVRVRFSGRLTDAFVVDRVETSDHEGTLAFLSKVVSAEPVLSPAVLGLCRSVADRWAGTLSDVLRLAVPPRHARAEAQPSERVRRPAAGPSPTTPGRRGRTARRSSPPSRRGSGPGPAGPRCPAHDPAEAVAEAVLATLHAGRGSIVCVPDVRDVARWHETFTRGAGGGPARRPHRVAEAGRAVSRVPGGGARRGAGGAGHPRRRVRAGGRPGAGRDVRRRRRPLRRAARAVPAHARDPAHPGDPRGCGRAASAATRAPRRARRSSRAAGAPTSSPNRSRAGDAGRPWRSPTEPSTAAHRPVCRTRCSRPSARPTARCSSRCRGAAIARRSPASDAARRHAARSAAGRSRRAAPARPSRAAGADTSRRRGRAPTCGGDALRAPSHGPRANGRGVREGLSRSPGRHVRWRRRPRHRRARPRHRARHARAPSRGAAGGYALVVLMDTWLMLSRDDVRVVEESHRRWFNALALARETAPAVAVGDPATLQALVRADPIGLASRELAIRAETHLPPIGRLATVDGPADVVEPLAGRTWTPNTEVLGPVADGRRRAAGPAGSAAGGCRAGRSAAGRPGRAQRGQAAAGPRPRRSADSF